VLQSTEIEVNLTPEEVEGLDEAQLKALYEEKVAEAKAQSRREDFSDLVAAKAAQQKRKIAQKAEDKAAKKSKDFKF
jgi:splicing factor 3B subunit 2